MDLVGAAVLLAVFSTAAGVVVWLQQVNRRDPRARDAEPLSWFLVVAAYGPLGLLFYWLLVDERGPVFRPITDADVAAWRRGRRGDRSRRGE